MLNRRGSPCLLFVHLAWLAGIDCQQSEAREEAGRHGESRWIPRILDHHH